MKFDASPLFRRRNKASIRSPNDAAGTQRDVKTPVNRFRRRKAAIAAVCAVAVLVLGIAPATYSYLTASSETVVNTFAGGAISLTLDEAKVDTDGDPIDGEPRVQENTYKVVPGAELTKDPTVTVLEGSEVCYVYLYVDNALDETYFTLDYSDDWIEVASVGTKTLYVYKTTVDASDGDVALTPIFTTVKVSYDLTSEQIEEMGEVQITVQSYAIQAEGVDVETSIGMAVAYFESEYDITFSNVNTSITVAGSDTSADADSAAAEDSDTSSDTTEESSAAEETESSDASDSEESSKDEETSIDSSSDEADETTSEDASDAAEETSSESADSADSDSEETAADSDQTANTESEDSMTGTENIE